jgi:hypothetical protein
MLYNSTINLCDYFKIYGEISDETIAVIKEKFNWVTDKTSYIAIISSLQYNEILQQDTYTGILPSQQCKTLFNDEVIMAERIFCMNSATSFITGFKLPEENLTLTWLPSFCKILFKAKNYKEFGLAYPTAADSYETYIFHGNPEQVESTFELSELRGSYDTYYRATIIDNQPVKIDRYAVNEEATIFNFDLQHLILAKRLKRIDLL